MKLSKNLIFLSSAVIFSLLGLYTGKLLYAPKANSIFIDPAKTIFFNPTTLDDAHSMVLRFRNASGLCPIESSCSSLLKAGFFELNEATVNDLASAVNTIKREVTAATSKAPASYRVVFAMDSQGKTRLIVVGLEDRTLVELTAYSKIIDGGLPCPLVCDVRNSSIIMGPQNNACN